MAGITLMGFFAWLVLRPVSHFDFLSGTTPLAVPWPHPYPSVHTCNNGHIYSCYDDWFSLPKDFATVRSLAERELFSKGYKLARLSLSPGYDHARYVRENSDSNWSWEDWVEIDNDKRYFVDRARPYYPLSWQDAPGWTGVRVVRAIRQSPQQAFVSRCRQWVNELIESFGLGPQRIGRPYKLPDAG
jgi:hypothetical protein